MKLKAKTANRCKQCGFKIRGPNHEEGQHHKRGSGGKATFTSNPY
jgi:hypothetical protein